MGLAQLGVCIPLTSSNPMFGANRLKLNRDADSVVVLTPNIGLILLTSRRSVGIYAALNLGDTFLMAEDHRGNGDRAAYNHSRDRHQQPTQARNRIDHSHHAPPPSFLVELTGIEPVASWLQTRRSPS
jgi:hypothetical protein